MTINRFLLFALLTAFGAAGSLAISAEIPAKANARNTAGTIVENGRVTSMRVLQVKADSQEGGRATSERLADVEEQAWLLDVMTATELVADHQYRVTDSERIEASRLGGFVSLRDRLSLVVVSQFEQYEYDPDDADDEQSNLSMLEIRTVWDVAPRLTLRGSIIPYGGTDADGMGVSVGGEWRGRKGLVLGMDGTFHEPWRDSTLSVLYDGYRHDITSNVYWPITRRLTLFGSAQWNWFGLDRTDDGGGEDLAGQGYEWFSRLEYRVWMPREHRTAPGWLDRELRYDDAVNSEITLFGQAFGSEYEDEGGFDTVPVTLEEMDVRGGVRLQYAVTAKLGMSVEGFVGQDNERAIAWGDLYGMQTRVIWQPLEQWRLSARYAMISSSGSAVAAGREETVGISLSTQF